jgi:hypothetical protein
MVGEYGASAHSLQVSKYRAIFELRITVSGCGYFLPWVPASYVFIRRLFPLTAIVRKQLFSLFNNPKAK